MYFRELPDSIVSATLYAAFIRAGRLTTENERVQELANLVQNQVWYCQGGRRDEHVLIPIAQLHRPNFETLRKLMRHLQEVAKNSKTNRMTVRNLCPHMYSFVLMCRHSTPPGSQSGHDLWANAHPAQA